MTLPVEHYEPPQRRKHLAKLGALGWYQVFQLLVKSAGGVVLGVP